MRVVRTATPLEAPLALRNNRNAVLQESLSIHRHDAVYVRQPVQQHLHLHNVFTKPFLVTRRWQLLCQSAQHRMQDL